MTQFIEGEEKEDPWNKTIATSLGFEEQRMQNVFKDLILHKEHMIGPGYKRTPESLGAVGRRVYESILRPVGKFTKSRDSYTFNDILEKSRSLYPNDWHSRAAFIDCTKFIEAMRNTPSVNIPPNWRMVTVAERLFNILEGMRPQSA